MSREKEKLNKFLRIKVNSQKMNEDREKKI
jgi:hypothetical protein